MVDISQLPVEELNVVDNKICSALGVPFLHEFPCSQSETHL